MTRDPGQRPLVLILGAGLSGLTLATMLERARLDVMVLEQDFPPGRPQHFHGVVTNSDLATVGLDPGQLGGAPVREVTSSAGSKTMGGWVAIEHRQVLDGLRRLARSRGVTVVSNQEQVDLVWRQAELNGVRTRIGGLTFEADLVVFADESDPRMPESLGLRPDWLPTELMHIAKLRFDGAPNVANRINAFTSTASWGSGGFGVVVPGADAVTVKVAMLLEDEMDTARHIGEYLDEILREPEIAGLVSGLERGSLVTEVVPVGGFARRNRFQRDRALVASDLVGVTHPLNRDGCSTTVTLCRIAADVINESADGSQITVRQLDRYSNRVAAAFPDEAKSRRRKDRNLAGHPAWQWFSLADLVEPAGVTSPPNDAKLTRIRGFRRRLNS